MRNNKTNSGKPKPKNTHMKRFKGLCEIITAYPIVFQSRVASVSSYNMKRDTFSKLITNRNQFAVACLARHMEMRIKFTENVNSH